MIGFNVWVGENLRYSYNVKCFTAPETIMDVTAPETIMDDFTCVGTGS